MTSEQDSGGCVNQAFEAADDGFQTIDLRKTKNEEQEHIEFQQNTTETQEVVNVTSHVTETRCGWSTFRPVCLQKFRTAKWALFWLCWAGAIQGMVVNGFVNVVITTIERRFGLRSMQTGIIAGGYDMASFICLAPVTYLGGRVGSSKPRWIGWGVLLMGVGSLVFALPHFLVPPYRQAVLEEDDLCIANRTLRSECEDGNMGEGNWAVLVFLCAQLLHGAGATPLFTLGVTYIDENVSKKMSSVYLGIYYTMAVIGPALGYVLGGQMLNIYTDFATVDPETIGITPSSSIWIGAWWVGFIVSAFLCFVVALPLLAFPYELPGAEEIRSSKVSEAHEGAASKSAAFSALRELPRAAAALLKNPTFMFLNLAGASEGMLISGFAAFMPKLIENQFAVSAAEAALLLGVITVPAGGGGTFLGGWLVKRWKLTCAGIIKLCVAATVLSAVFTFCFVLTCPDYAFAGITVPYKDSQLTSAGVNRLSSGCNSECSCGWQYSPVCGADGVVYYSSCHAGCHTRTISQGNTLYADCSCITTNYTLPSYQFGAVLASTQNNASVSYSAVNSVCPSDCPYLWVFVALAFGIMLFTFIATMPALSATLRCVREDQRSFALGIQWIKVRLLGTIPAPLIFGFLIDLSCSFWKKECDVTGACLLYDNVNMSRYMLALAFVGKLCSLLFFFLAWWLYKAPGSNKKTSVAPAIEKTNGIANGYCNPGLDCTEHLIGITPSSSIWIGAWWVGFIVSAFLCFVVALPLLAFPYELPGAEEIRSSKVSEAHEGAASKSAAFSALRELPRAAAALLKNPTFMFLNLAGASEGMLISGFAAFMPKLIENQFAVSAAEAALLLGVITVPAGGGGTFLGGWLVKRWKLTCAGIIKLCVAATVLSAVFTFCFVLTCPDYAFAGITVPYKDSQLTSAGVNRLSSGCNSECSCGWQYSPVCGADGVVYYSSCHAGCHTRTISQGNTLYADCSCITTNYTLPSYQFGAVLASTQNNASVSYSAVNSVCPSDCPYLWVFVALAFGIMLFTFIATMPALSATLRCVREDQRSFALGIQWIKVRLLGTIPAPLIFGFLIDLSCSFWKKECDVTGACLLYDNVNMSRYMLALAFVGKLCSLLFFFLAWWLYKAPGSNKKTSVAPAIEKTNGIANGYCNPGLDCTEHL